MKIKLLVDYRGELTDEAFYPAGEYGDGDIPAGHMRGLVAAGRAEEVTETTPEPVTPEKPKRGQK